LLDIVSFIKVSNIGKNIDARLSKLLFHKNKVDIPFIKTKIAYEWGVLFSTFQHFAVNKQQVFVL